MERYKRRFKEGEYKSPYLTNEAVSSIDISKLESKLSAMLKTPIKISLSLVKVGSDDYIYGESQELVNKTGIFRVSLKSCKVNSFNSLISTRNKGWGVSWHIEYQHVNGGSSDGPWILDSWYEFDTKDWTFKEP